MDKEATNNPAVDAVATPQDGTQAPQVTPPATPPATPAAAENKPAETKVDARTPEKPADEKLAAAPEKYDFKAPEGKAFDEAVLNEFSTVAKELNLTQDAAQKMLDKMAPSIAAQQQARIESVRAEWETSSRADKEFGGEKLTENLAVAKTFADKFSTPELKQLLNETGLGNHPEVIRLFYRAGKAISQDTFVGGRGTSSTELSNAQRMYPGMNP